MRDIMKTLQELLSGHTHESTGNLDTPVSSVTYDSRQVQPGALFVALPGANADGTTFIEDAVKRGAAAVVTQAPIDGLNVPTIRVADARRALSRLGSAFYNHPSRDVTLIGITGTKGKTTTTYLVQSILKTAMGKAFRFGTVEHDLGGTVKPAKNTTPESLDLMSFLDEAKKSGCRAGVMEVSSHALKNWRVEDLTFAVAGFSNLSMEHTEFHPTMEDYFQAKRRLFANLLPKGKTSVVNIDTDYGARLAEEIRGSGAPVLTVSLDKPGADFHARNLDITGRQSRFTLVAGEKTFSCEIQLPGHFNAGNALMAGALCAAVGIGWDDILAGLAAVKRVPGRFETIPNTRDLTVIVDYAHSPASLENVLKAVRPLTKKRVITVFGCGGNRSPDKRPVMGRISAELSDVTIVTSDNPRKEKPEEIISQILGGIDRASSRSGREVHVEADRRKAIDLAVSMATPGDIVLIAGKGHETGQTFADRVIPFDDREVARECLERRSHA